MMDFKNILPLIALLSICCAQAAFGQASFKQPVHLDLYSSDRWVQTLDSCIESRVAALDHIEVTGDNPMYKVTNIGFEDGGIITAAYSIYSIPALHIGGQLALILGYLNATEVISLNTADNYEELIGQLIRDDEYNRYFKSLYEGVLHEKNKTVISYSTSKLPEACESITTFIGENVPTYEELKEKSESTADSSEDVEVN